MIWDLDGTLIDLEVDWIGLKAAKKHVKDWETTDRYELENIHQAEPIERSVECVQELKNRGCKLAICSSNMHETIVQSLKKMGIRNFFDIIVGSNNVNKQKPHPEGLNIIVRILGIAKEKIVFIGDSWRDEEAGKRANIQTVLLCETKSLR